MNRVLIRILILLVISGVFFIIILRSRQPFGKTNSSFASEPKEEITKIEFSQRGKRLILEKKGEAWMVDGKYEARKSAVFFVIRILKEMKIKSPVSSQLFDSLIIEKKDVPVRVRVYENRKLLKSFLVYKTESNNYGNIMKMRERTKPFIVYIPGFEGDIGAAFTLNELFWQPYTVFDLLPSEIASVRFENIQDTSSSFTIINKGHHCSLSGAAGWDSSTVFRYLSYFARVPFESWAFYLGDSARRSIESHQPLYRISVITETGRKSTLTLWEMYNESNGAKITDSDRLYGKIDDRDELFIMRYFDIDPLIKKRSYFFKR